MKTTVSYLPTFGNDYFFNQTIKVTLTSKEFTDLNNTVIERLKTIQNKDICSAEEMYTKMYLKQFYRGKNFCTRTQKDWFINHFNICNKRIFDNRNTVIEITVH